MKALNLRVARCSLDQFIRHHQAEVFIVLNRFRKDELTREFARYQQENRVKALDRAQAVGKGDDRLLAS